MSEAAPLDRRLAAFRPDLADARLQGQVEAQRFVDGEAGEVVAAHAPVRRRPAPDAPLDTEVLAGERVSVFERDGEGWAWIQGESDGYVGYAPADAIAAPGAAPSHRVTAPETLRFPEPDIKAPPVALLPMGARLAVVDAVERDGRAFARLADATFVVGDHLAPVAAPVDDWVSLAENLVGTPYLWGGMTRRGIDCSGLVRAALLTAGRPAPRDSDMQEKALGEIVAFQAMPPGLERGDLLFFPGHVGIMVDDAHILHANAHHMLTVIEPVSAVLTRAEAAGAPLRSVRRLPPAQ